MKILRSNVVATLFTIWLLVFSYLAYNVYQWANLINKNITDTYKNNN